MPAASSGFAYDLLLPRAIDATAVTATLRRGALTIHRPKTAAERRRQIPARAAALPWADEGVPPMTTTMAAPLTAAGEVVSTFQT